MAEVQNQDRPLTSARVVDVIHAAGFRLNEAIGSMSLYTGVRKESNSGRLSISRIEVEHTDNIKRRLPAGIFQIARRMEDGRNEIKGPVFKVDPSGKVSPSSKDEFIKSVLPSEYRTWTETPEAAAKYGRGPTEAQRDQAMNRAKARDAAEAQPKPTAGAAKEKKEPAKER